MSRFWNPAAATLATLALAAAISPAPPLRADDKSLAAFYENKIVGFRFRPMNGWASVPPGTDPDDPKICGFYSDAAKFDNTVKPECDVYAFKLPKEDPVPTEGLGGAGGDDGKKAKPPSEEEARKALIDSFRFKTTRDVVEKTLQRHKEVADQSIAQQDEKKQKKLKEKLVTKALAEKTEKCEDGILTTLDATFTEVLTNGRDLFFTEARLCGGFIRNDEYEVGVVYLIPNDGWKKYGNTVMGSLRSIEFLKGADVTAARQDLADALSNAKTDDERWLEAVKRHLTAGWGSTQTKHYLVVYDKSVDPKRIREIAVRIEAIRKDVYEVLFPPDRPVTAISVVRFCKDETQYHQYGGPPSTGGYWLWVAQELVLFEDKTLDPLRVLNHEAFHQYIFYSVGSISPHDWFNEGHGDYFAGHDIGPGGRFVPKPFGERTSGSSSIKTAITTKKFVPLKDFVTFSHAQYYGPQISQNYSQGWSLIWFLRQTKNPRWKDILPNYFNTLKAEVTKWVDDEIAAKKKDGTYTEGWKPSITPDDVEENARKKALDAAFPPSQFDDATWARFEKEWKETKF